MKIKTTYSEKPMPYDYLFSNLYPEVKKRIASFKKVRYKRID